MIEVIRLSFEDRRDFELWQDYIQARPDSHCTDLAEWRLLFRALYGFDEQSYVCTEEGRVAGALSLYHIRSPFMGNMLVTCPFFGYGGLYWESEAARDALLERALAVGRELGVDYVELRLRRELPSPFQANADFAEFDLELGATPDETWSRLSSNARQNIRKSRTPELEFRLSAQHGPCCELLKRTLRAHGTPFHGERFFELLAAQLGDRVRYSEVWHGNRIVAGGVAIQFKQTLITPYIGSLVALRGLRPNYLQYWGLVEHAHEQGLRRFEMGRSPRGSTHAQFKEKWGCTEVPALYNYRVVNARKGYRSVSRPSAIQRLGTRVWSRLPLAFTGALGSRLARYIP